MGKAASGVIYGIRLRAEFDYRYIGLTTKSEHVRLRQHFKAASTGRKTPFYDWLRKQDTASRSSAGPRSIGSRIFGRKASHYSTWLMADSDLLVWTGLRKCGRLRGSGRPAVRV